MNNTSLPSDIFRHIWHFLPKLAGYGLILGGLFGALTYPVFGAIIGAPWGLAAGMLLAILMGIGIPVYNRYFADVESEDYQSRLTIGVGLMTTVIFALPLLFIYAPFAGITAAYLAHQYAETPSFSEKRKHDLYQRRPKAMTRLATEILHKAKWVAGLGILAVLALFSWESPPISDYFFIAILGVIYSAVTATSIAAINGVFVSFANRLYFSPDMPKSKYKIQVVTLVSVLTLFLSAIVTFGVGAPFAAAAAGWGAAKYADWYYDGEEEKKKRSDRDFAHLEDDLDDSDFSEEDESLRQQERDDFEQ